MEVAKFNTYKKISQPDIPAIVGITDADLYEHACSASDTVFCKVDNMRVPLVVNTDFTEWVNTRFFEHRLGAWTAVEPAKISEISSQEILKLQAYGGVLLSLADIEKSQVSSIEDVFEPYGGKTRQIIQECDNQESRVSYFSATIETDIEHVPKEGCRNDLAPKLDANKLEYYRGTVPDKLFENLWQMYEPAFKNLTDEHPVVGIQTKDELKDFVDSDESCTLVYSRDSQPSAFISLCPIDNIPWINQDFYIKKYPQQYKARKIIYSPVLVGRQDIGGYSALSLARHLGDYLANDIGDCIFVGECPNRSEPYVTYLVKRAEHSKSVKSVSIEFVSRLVFREVIFG